MIGKQQKKKHFIIYPLLKYFSSFFIIIALIYESITTFFLFIGGIIVWASPLISASEWGQDKVINHIIMLCGLILSLVTIWIKSPPRKTLKGGENE